MANRRQPFVAREEDPNGIGVILNLARKWRRRLAAAAMAISNYHGVCERRWPRRNVASAACGICVLGIVSAVVMMW